MDKHRMRRPSFDGRAELAYSWCIRWAISYFIQTRRCETNVHMGKNVDGAVDGGMGLNRSIKKLYGRPGVGTERDEGKGIPGMRAMI